MNIHSKFHDYYDGVVAQYRDDAIHWNRKEEQITNPNVPVEIKRWAQSRLSRWTNLMRDHVDYTTDVVGICGKFYPLLRIVESKKPTQFIYDRQKILDVLEDVAISRGHYYAQTRKGIRLKQEYSLDELQELRNDQLFIDAKSPIILFKSHTIKGGYITVKDANLSNIEFYKCIDSWQMMTELSAYFGTVLTREDDIPEPDNKTKIVSAGFDLKSSFRKSKDK